MIPGSAKSAKASIPVKMPDHPHFLASECMAECPMRTFHYRTLEIIEHYPSLYWNGTMYLHTDPEGITEILPTTGNARRNPVDYKQDYWQREGNVRDFIYSGKRGLHEEFYLPSTLPILSILDKNVMSAWHNSIIEFLRGQLDAWIPILPIQALWLLDNEVPSRFPGSQPFGLAGSAVLENPYIPDELFERYGYHKNSLIRQSLSRNPRCPEDIQVAIALLDEKLTIPM
jgi:hypothetical protein